jgi:hypothetical protein
MFPQMLVVRETISRIFIKKKKIRRRRKEKKRKKCRMKLIN